MSLSAFTGLPIIPVGHANKSGVPAIGSFSNTTIDATNEACHMVGRLYWEDGGSHTVDTTGSSSIKWLSNAVVFSNAGTTFKVGIAAVNTTTGPPVRAVNVADVITFDVSASFTGGGSGVTGGGAWETSVPTSGTKTIATGDLLVVGFQMTARAGTDVVLVASMGLLSGAPGTPSVTDFTGAAYSSKSTVPNVVITASDGTRGYIYGGFVAETSSTAQTWNSGSSPNEYGNILRFPFPVRAYGVIAAATLTGDCDFILYSTPLGTPASQRSVSVDLNTLGTSSTANEIRLPFSSSFDLAANTDYAVIAKPTSVTNVSMIYKTYNASAHQNSDLLGTDCYAINRASGAFAAQNSSKDRFAIGLLVGAFDAGTSGPSGKLVSVARGSPY